MPLLDHFRPPVFNRVSWQEIHGMWPGEIAKDLNRTLPPEYLSGVQIRLGNMIEVDVATFGTGGFGTTDSFDNSGVQFESSAPTLLLDAEEMIPAEYEVRVYDTRTGRRLVAAIELVSPSNKDRESSRDAFVSKCHALLDQDVNVIIVDPVTNIAANLYADLAERLGGAIPRMAESPIYAASIQRRSSGGRTRLIAWDHALTVGADLPNLPLWLSDTLSIPLRLEQTYAETCRNMRLT